MTCGLSEPSSSARTGELLSRWATRSRRLALPLVYESLLRHRSGERPSRLEHAERESRWDSRYSTVAGRQRSLRRGANSIEMGVRRSGVDVCAEAWSWVWSGGVFSVETTNFCPNFCPS